MDPPAIVADSASLRMQCDSLGQSTKALLDHKVPDHYHILSRLDEELRQISLALSAISEIWCRHSSILMTNPTCNWDSVRDNIQGTGLAVRGLMNEIEPVAQAGKKGWIKKIFVQSLKMGWHATAIATYGSRVSCHLAALEVSLTMMKLVLNYREGELKDWNLQLVNLQHGIQKLEGSIQSITKPSLPSANDYTESRLMYVCIGRIVEVAKAFSSWDITSIQVTLPPPVTESQKLDDPPPQYSPMEVQHQQQEPPTPESQFPQATPLHIAARAANLAEVRRLIASGADTSVRCDQGQTPVYAAALSGNTNVIEYIIKQGGDFKTTTLDEWTPLNAAAANGHAHAVELLLSHGADPCIPTNCGQSPIYSAAANGHLEVVQVLVNNGVNASDATPLKNWTPLNTATAYGHLTVVQYLLSQGADPNIPQEDGWTPLHVAANKNMTELVQLLVQVGADTTLKNKDAQTPFDLANKNGNPDVFLVFDV